MKQYRYILFTLCVVFLIIRLPYLDQLFLLHDERDIVFSGYSIAKTEHDLFGNFMPLSFNNISPDNPLFAIYFSALMWLIIPMKSVFAARLPYVLITSILPWLIFTLLRKLKIGEKEALLTSIICCFSPWIFHITRIAMDIPLAFVLLIAGMIAYLSKKYWVTYITFFMAFYTYQGFRTLIPFLLLYLELFNTIVLKTNTSLKKMMTINVVFLVILFASISLIDPKVTANRFGQVVFLNNEKFVPEVNLRRNSSIAPPKLRAAFDNKITVTIDYIVSNFVKGQGLLYLFKDGDYSPINGNGVTGQFFLPFIILYYLGIMAFGKSFTRKDAYMLGLLLIGFIPSLVTNVSATFSIRAIVTAIGFSYIMARGGLFAYELISKQKIMIRKAVYAVFVIMLLPGVLYFGYNYYLRKPVTVGELFNEKERRLAGYLNQHKKKIILYVNAPKENIMSYAFLYNDISITDLQKSLKSGEPYKTSSLTFYKCPPKMDYTKLHNAIVGDGCLDKAVYDKMALGGIAKHQIGYTDISGKVAYFVME